jgi:hypothetical protein
MIRNASPDPFLQIQADGKIIQTDRISGAKKESKLTPAELQDLLRFVVYENDFLNADPKKVQPAAGKVPAIVTDGTITTIRVHANNKQHEASYYMVSFALANNPNAKPLVQYAAVEWRLNQLAYFVGLAPAADANPPAAIALPKDPKAVVLSMTVSHKEIPTRKEVRPDGGMNIFQGSPRTDQVLQIQADGKVLVTNRVSGAKKETQLTASQLQDVLRFMIRDNDFFNQASIKLPDKDNPDARKLVISVQTGDKQHEVSVDGRWVDAKGKIGTTCSWLNNLARTYVWPSGTGWEY